MTSPVDTNGDNDERLDNGAIADTVAERDANDTGERLDKAVT